jgi:hypothetical protein
MIIPKTKGASIRATIGVETCFLSCMHGTLELKEGNPSNLRNKLSGHFKTLVSTLRA